MFEKLDVNGEGTHDIYAYLRSHAPPPQTTYTQQGPLCKLINWNFAKFLVDSEGKVVKHYKPATSPLQIKPDIENLIKGL